MKKGYKKILKEIQPAVKKVRGYILKTWDEAFNLYKTSDEAAERHLRCFPERLLELLNKSEYPEPIYSRY